MKFIPIIELRTTLDSRGLEPGEFSRLADGREIVALPCSGNCFDYAGEELISCIFDRKDEDLALDETCEHVFCGGRIYVPKIEALKLRLQGHDFVHRFATEAPGEAAARRLCMKQILTARIAASNLGPKGRKAFR